jgi:hypothetical protein
VNGEDRDTRTVRPSETAPLPRTTANEQPGLSLDPFAHYADRATQLTLRSNARLVSNSEIQTFKRCRRKWWLAWFRGLRPRVDTYTGPRAIGDRVHRALALWYQPVNRIEPLAALNGLISADLRTLMGSKHYQSLEPSEQSELLRKWKGDADLERAMIEGYVQWLEETGADSDIIILDSERYLDARLPVPNEDIGYPVYIIAKLDARVRRLSDGVRQFIDHKTVAAFGPKSMAAHQSEQMLMYHLIEYLNAVTDRCEGALYNMLRRVKRTVQAKPPFFQRFPIWHNSHQLASLRHRLIGTIGEILDAERRLRESPGVATPYRVAYPTPTETCAWDCDFVAVCPLFDDGSRAEDMLKTHYSQGDPLSYYLTDNHQRAKEK